MTIDTLAVTALCHELQAFVGAKIQDSVIASPLSLALELYHQRQRRWLLLSAHPKLARLALHSQRIPRGVDQATPLLLLLRKYVEGGRVIAVEQPDLERIISLSIAKPLEPRNPDEPVTELVTVKLIIEIMDQRSNIFLVDEHGTVIECVKRVTAQMSRRVALPQHPYTIPPIPDKADPRTGDATPLLATLVHEPNIAKALVSTYRGVSPQMAREATFRGDDDASQSVAQLAAMFAAPAQPSIIHDEYGVPQFFAAYQLTHKGHFKQIASVSDAIIAYVASREALGDYRRRRDALAQRINDHRERVMRQFTALNQEMTKAEALEQLRWEGQMIYAYIHDITPSMSSLVVEGQSISLTPHVPPSLQAQERFKQYDKAKSALAGLPERIQKATDELAGIDETLTFLDLAESFEAIESVARDALNAGWVRAADVPRQARVKPLPPLRYSFDSFIVYCGRNAYQNQLVTFTIGESQDIWMHARGMPGGHVIIKTQGRPVPPDVMRQAAALAAYHSKSRNELAVDIDYCRRSGVRKVRGGPPGLVTCTADGTLRVAPHKAPDLP
jgi:predicted ribosome quality control (RQC) complex YloA/Tae2 family protein